MSEKEAQDRAAKARIISHMNKDHHDSVIRYLQHYSKVSAFNAYDGRLSDIDLNGMTLSCQGKSHRVPFEPPMTSYREARERVVELDKECRRSLGHSDVTVRSYLPPTGLYYSIGFAIIAATFIGYSQRWWFAEEGPVEQYIGSSFAAFSWRIQPYLLAGMLVIHSGEMIYFASRKLTTHSVSVRTSTFWLWVFSSFIEGQLAFKRFDDHVKAQREKQKL